LLADGRSLPPRAFARIGMIGLSALEMISTVVGLRGGRETLTGAGTEHIERAKR
jgi:hypothetical protein